MIENTVFYSKLGILKLVDLVIFKKSMLVFKYRLKAPPAQFTDYFTEGNTIYKRSTRRTIKKITLLHS